MPPQVENQQTFDEATALARGHLYSFFASAFADPSGTHCELALDPNRRRVAIAAADLLAGEAPDGPDGIEPAPGECSPALLDLRSAAEELSRPRTDVIAEHQKVFGLLSGTTVPLNETEYCRSTDSFHRAQELADVAGFYRAFGLRRDPREPERPDHISLELDFMARLIEKEMLAVESRDRRLREKSDLCRDAQRKFFAAHVGWWVAGFAQRLRQSGVGRLYGALAAALAAFIPIERRLLGVEREPVSRGE